MSTASVASDRGSTRLAGALIGAMIAFAAAPAHAEATKPRWELGVGLAPLTVPAYPGAAQQRYFVFPLPLVIYRSEWLRVDRGGAKGLLWSGERAALDVSIDGAVPVDSTDDGPREGMDELDPLVELGPSLKIDLTAAQEQRLELWLPVRAAISVSSTRVARQGWKFHPQLHYDGDDRAGRWDFALTTGPKFSSRNLHGYYYDVPPADTRPGRPAYEAPSGYSGFSVVLTANRSFGDYWVGSFVRYENLSGARFDDSPLVETQHAVSAGLAVTWILWRSESTVTLEREHDRGAR